MNMFHDYKQSLMEVDEGGRATIHYNTHWTKEPMQKTYRSAKHMSDDELKAQHYKLFGGSVTKIERDHEYEPKKEKIHMNDKPGHLMDDIDAHVKPALDEASSFSNNFLTKMGYEKKAEWNYPGDKRQEWTKTYHQIGNPTDRHTSGIIITQSHKDDTPSITAYHGVEKNYWTYQGKGAYPYRKNSYESSHDSVQDAADALDTHVKQKYGNINEEAWPHYIDRYRKDGDSIILWQAGHYNYYTTKGAQNAEGRFDRVHKFYDKDHLDAHQELRSQGWELDKQDDTPKKKIRVTEQTLSEGVHVVLINRYTGQRVVIKREHVEMYPPREGWQPISSVQTESTEIVNDTPKHLMTFKTTDERGNSRYMHIYQKNDSNWYEIKGPVAMHANAVFLNGKIGDFEAEQHAHTIANMVGAGEHDRALEYLNKYSTMSWNKDYDQPEAETYRSQSLQDRSYRMNEASGREVISAKLKTMDTMRRVRIPTPQERRAEFEKQQREKEAEQQRLAKPTLAKEETDRMSQYVDLINQDLKNNRY